MTLGKAKAQLTTMMKAKMANPDNCRMIPFLQGQPGIGKTSIVKELADEWDWRLWTNIVSQSSPEDLKGAPFFDQIGGLKVTTNCPPQHFPLVGFPDSAEGKNVLCFLDELRQAPTVLQNLAGNVIDGVVGDYRIDQSRFFIIIASNRDEDLAAVQPIPNNLINRICIIDIDHNYDEWLDWAVDNNIHPYVLGFLQNHNTHFCQMPNGESLTNYPTPRTWCEVSNFIEAYGADWHKDITVETILKGWVGPSASSLFWNFSKRMLENISIDEIFKGNFKNSPKSSDVLFGLIMEGIYRMDALVEKCQAIEGSSKDLKKELKPSEIDLINNFFTWLASDVHIIDPAYTVMGLTLSKSSVRNYRNVMIYSHTIFKDAAIAHKKIMTNFKPVGR